MSTGSSDTSWYRRMLDILRGEPNSSWRLAFVFIAVELLVIANAFLLSQELAQPKDGAPDSTVQLLEQIVWGLFIGVAIILNVSPRWRTLRPGIYLAIGIGGTFVGILISVGRLGQQEEANLGMENLEGLFGAVALAFISSIVGLILSNVANFQIRAIANRIEDDLSAQEQSLLDVSQEQLDAINGLDRTIGAHLQNFQQSSNKKLEEALEELIEANRKQSDIARREFLSQLRNYQKAAKTIADDITPRLEATVKALDNNRKLQSRLGKQYEGLLKRIREASQEVEKTREAWSVLTAVIEEGATKGEALLPVISKIGDGVDRLEAQYALLGETQEALRTAADSLATSAGEQEPDRHSQPSVMIH